MAGGLLNLIALGNQNIILTGNPTKSFFKTKYAKYTNFGMQKFRVDQVGQTKIDLSKETKYRFKIPRRGDLLMDTFLVLTLPNIWSPIYKYTNADLLGASATSDFIEYRPYEFQWIKNIGSQLIKEVQFSIGGHLIQKYSGSYIQNVVERDFDNNKKELFNIMTGNTKELNDPANYANRNNNYPNAFNPDTRDISGIEPSIPETQLYIPINSWYSMTSTMAFPLICLQYAEFEIDFILNPIEKLFTIKDVIYDFSNNDLNIIPKTYDNLPRIRPISDKNEVYSFNRFIQQPPIRDITNDNKIYENNLNNIDSKIHLITTQCFLDNEERTLFAKNNQEYLIKLVYYYPFDIKQQAGKVKLESNGGLVSNWMWYFQRSDVKDRNEWSNYTNWPYENKIPNNLKEMKNDDNNSIFYPYLENYVLDNSKNIFYTGYTPSAYDQQNHKDILKNFAIIIDGALRENDFESGIYNKIEKYNRTLGNFKEGLYNYNFSLNNDPYKIQPSGAFNTNKFKTIEFEYNLVSNPPFNLEKLNFTRVCDQETGEVIATSKDPGSIYQYNYMLYVYEERYNILEFKSGTASLKYSR